MKKQTIDFTKAIVSGAITFEQACALQAVGMDMTAAISEGILTFEEACAISGLATEAANTPKAPKAPKPKKQAKKPAKAAEPKDEEQPKEPVYTKGGLLLQWNDDIAAKGKEKAIITKGYNSLTKQGFTVTRKRVGTWIELYRTKGEDGKYTDGKTAKEFAAAKLDSGWQFIKGAWKYPALLDSYEDSFRK